VLTAEALAERIDAVSFGPRKKKLERLELERLIVRGRSIISAHHGQARCLDQPVACREWMEKTDDSQPAFPGGTHCLSRIR
jgi:hypothetical protein